MLGLELRAQKSVYVKFTRSNAKTSSSEIKVKNTIIKFSNSGKFLGIISDHKLSFTEHVNYVQKKCLRAMNVSKMLRGTWWGAEPGTLLIIYKSLVRSIIDYGSFIYFPVQQNQINKLEKIQFAAVRLALGYRNSTPTNVLISEAKLTFLQERAKAMYKCYQYKILSNRGLPIYEKIKHLQRCTGNKKRRLEKNKRLVTRGILDTDGQIEQIYTSNNYLIYTDKLRIMFSKIRVDTEFGQTLGKSNNPNEQVSAKITDECSLLIFTDGSKMEHSIAVGSAAICPDLQQVEVRSISRNASIYTAECLALLSAINIASSHPTQDFIIFSDSLSALQALNSNQIDIKINPYIYEIKKKAIEYHTRYPQRKALQFIWIPAHIGIEGNELADSTAKDATNRESDTTAKIPFTDYRQDLMKAALIDTRKIIQEQGNTKGVDYFTYYYDEKMKPWFQNKNISPEIISIVNRCRSGHYNLASSLTRIKILEDSSCSCGHGKQDLDYILWQCPLLDKERTHFIQNLRKINYYLPLSSQLILAEPTTRICKIVEKYLKKCNLRI